MGEVYRGDDHGREFRHTIRLDVSPAFAKLARQAIDAYASGTHIAKEILTKMTAIADAVEALQSSDIAEDALLVRVATVLAEQASAMNGLQGTINTLTEQLAAGAGNQDLVNTLTETIAQMNAQLAAMTEKQNAMTAEMNASFRGPDVVPEIPPVEPTIPPTETPPTEVPAVSV